MVNRPPPTLKIPTLIRLGFFCLFPEGNGGLPVDYGAPPTAMGTARTMAASDSRMKAMQEMHQKMISARTPTEREALMADHMKAMQGGMAMMKEMHTAFGMGGMGGRGMMGSSGGTAAMAGMGDGKGMPADGAKRHPMMDDLTTIMQMMMDMMADRMPPASTGKRALGHEHYACHDLHACTLGLWIPMCPAEAELRTDCGQGD